MMQRLLSSLLFLSAIAFLVILDIVVLRRLTFGEPPIDVLLLVSVFLAIMFSYPWALVALLSAGTLLDIVTLTIGVHTAAPFLALLVAYALFLRFFTNKSLWSLLVLGVVATSIDGILVVLLTRSYGGLLPLIVVRLFWHSILWTLLFFAVQSVTKRLKPYVILRSYDL